MESLAQLVAAVVAVAASGVGIVVAVDQLTLRARLRRTAAWAREASAAETEGPRLAALEIVRLRAVAGVVAGHAVPVRFFATSVFFPAMAVTVSVLAYRRSEPWLPDLAVLVAVSTVGCWMYFRRIVRYYLERCSVANAYRAGDREVPSPRLDILSTMEGGVRVEFAVALGFSLGLNLGLVGLGLLGRNSASVVGVVLLTAGVLVMVPGWTWVRERGRIV